MVKLIDTFAEFVAKDDLAQKAAFEAAMINRIETEGYKMCDMLYELFQCQCDISHLKGSINELFALWEAEAKPFKVPKKKKKKDAE